jgi:hypothetical protein
MTSHKSHRRGSIAIGRLSAMIANVGALAGERLLADRALQRLITMSGAFSGVAQSFGFELRLSGDDDRVDLGVAIMRHGAATFASASPEDEERWVRIARLARAWCEDGSRLQSWAPFIFLEFDGDSSLDPVPVPSVFVGLDSPIEGSSASSPELLAAQQAASLLADSGSDEVRRASIARAFSELPDGARVLHVAVMLGRADPSVRLSVLLSGSEVGEYLTRLGSSVAARVAEGVRSRIGCLMGDVQLDFDLSSSARARIGFGLRPRPEGPVTWMDLLNRLGDAIAFSKEKRDALMSWPGISSYQGHDGGEAMLLRREISHLKLACSSEFELQLKAYVGVTPLQSI